MERARGIAYWSGAAILVALGYLSLFSIGAPLALTGFAMIIVGRSRHRREVLCPHSLPSGRSWSRTSS